jgi:hypothetical protein
VPLLQLAFKDLCFFQFESALVLWVGHPSEEHVGCNEPYAEILFEAPVDKDAGCLGDVQYFQVSIGGSQDQADDRIIISL